MGLAIVGILTACGGGGSTPSTNPGTTNPPATQPSTNDETIELESYKSAAISKLDEIVNPVIEKIPDEDLKLLLKLLWYWKQYVNGINDLETAKLAVNKVVDDTKAFAKDTLKPLAIQKLNGVINPLIEKITYEELKNSVQSFYDTEMAKIDATETLTEVSDTFKEILDDTKTFISTETEKVIIALKNKALEELDPYVATLIARFLMTL